MNHPFEINSTLQRYLKLGNHPQVLSKAVELWREARGLAHVQTWQRRLTRQDFESRFEAQSHSSNALQTLLGSCEYVCLLAVSLGDEIGNRIRAYFDEKKPLRGYLLDRMGSFMAEDAMKHLDRHWEAYSAAHGEQVTRRFSPGYQDFSLDAQKVFLALIDDRLTGLRMGDNGLLLPEKTITAIKGVFVKV